MDLKKRDLLWFVYTSNEKRVVEISKLLNKSFFNRDIYKDSIIKKEIIPLNGNKVRITPKGITVLKNINLSIPF